MAWERAETEEKGPKILIAGPTGSFKTRTILKACHRDGDPRLLLLDYEHGSDKYEKEFNFARVKIDKTMPIRNSARPDLSVTSQEVKDLRNDRHVYKQILDDGKVYGVDFARIVLLNRLAKNPIDFVGVDCLTIHWDWIIDKWLDIFFVRETKSKGHKLDYYTLQPSDHDKPKRELFDFISRLRALNVGTFATAHTKPKYSKKEFMEVIGVTADVKESAPHMFDTYVYLEGDDVVNPKDASETRRRWIATVEKDRSHLLGDTGTRFVWSDAQNENGYSESFLSKEKEALNWEGRKTEDLPRADENKAKKLETLADKAPPAEEKAPTPEPDKEPVSKDQLRQLVFWKEALNLSLSSWQSIIRTYEVSTARSLTKAQAGALLAKFFTEESDDRVLMDFESKFGRSAREAEGFQS